MAGLMAVKSDRVMVALKETCSQVSPLRGV